MADNVTLEQVGWGVTSVNSTQLSPDLRQVTVRKVNQQLCRERYQQLQNLVNSNFPITDNMLCAGLLDVGGADACLGDSGGPLVYMSMVVGVTSWRYSCAHPQYPGVSASIARYRNWIDYTINAINKSPSVSESRIILIFTLIFTMLHWQSS